MPWLETAPMHQRDRFITDHQHQLCSMTQLCGRYGISRKTGYKWLARFDRGGRPALRDRSHAPHSCPHRITPAVEKELLRLRGKYASWGPVKLLDWLARERPALPRPAASTVGDLLARHHLITPRRRRRHSPHPGVVPVTATAPNDLWTIDFKGQFKTRDGIYCYPLTLADHYARYLLVCQGLRSTQSGSAQRVLEAAFRTYGLPRAIRSDNGVPFATTGLHGLSRLNVWWLRLGIAHQRILPGQPQQNGAHERLHKTLKAETLRPPRGSLAAQQRAFNMFRQLYNEDRPHAALGGHTPASRYVSSPRAYPERLPALDYPGHFEVRHVSTAGTFRFQGQVLFIATALAQHQIGLTETADGIWSIYLGSVPLAQLSERDYLIRG